MANLDNNETTMSWTTSDKTRTLSVN